MYTGDVAKESDEMNAQEKQPVCGFGMAWVGACQEPVAKEGDRCSEHKDLVCCSCGKPATHACSETMTFVCGAPLCDDCEHTIYPNGCNSGCALPEGMKSHCKKTEQIYKPWYAREE